MAAPMVTGAFAVMREAYPTETLSQIWTRMANAGVSVTDTRSGGDTVAPRLDFTTAVTPSLDPPSPRFPKKQLRDQCRDIELQMDRGAWRDFLSWNCTGPTTTVSISGKSTAVIVMRSSATSESHTTWIANTDTMIGGCAH